MKLIPGDRFDLHLHTVCSDGTLPPGEMAAWAARAGMKCIAVTDHDSVEGVEQALESARALGMGVLTGVELTVQDTAELHLLGYGLQVGTQAYRALIARTRGDRQARNEAQQMRLKEENIQLPAAYRPENVPGVYGRMHVARGLVQGGYAADIDAAFREFLDPGGRVYVPRRRLPAWEALGMIQACGGKAVLAHPGRIAQWNDEELRQGLTSLAAEGLSGLEVFYPSHNAAQTAYYAALAQELGLTATYGSDCHGPQPRSPRPGYAFPEGQVPAQTYRWINQLLEG
ncbi:MAG: PHP domain-containing protein [Eubacteriales bacterium]|nr:PHP domain-containing protein [Eubacteriales bacterium]